MNKFASFFKLIYESELLVKLLQTFAIISLQPGIYAIRGALNLEPVLKFPLREINIRNLKGNFKKNFYQTQEISGKFIKHSRAKNQRETSKRYPRIFYRTPKKLFIKSPPRATNVLKYLSTLKSLEAA